MRPIDADALLNDPSIVYHTEFGDAVVDVEDIKKAPTLERPQGGWIPCSERLPEEKINPVTHDFEEVLCTTIWGDVRHYKFGTPIGHDEAHFWYGFGIMDEEVIAWMPLPEPYKAEREKYV